MTNKLVRVYWDEIRTFEACFEISEDEHTNIEAILEKARSLGRDSYQNIVVEDSVSAWVYPDTPLGTFLRLKMDTEPEVIERP